MNHIEYELIDIAFEPLVEEGGGMVSEDGLADAAIEYDADGIPMGDSREEIKIRQRMIFDFYEKWKAAHPEKSVYNRNLRADILIRKESVVEAAAHASKRYESTLAVMKLDEVLSEARQVAVDKPKSGNKNQAKLTQMLLMSYNCPEIGMIKLTVGVRRRTSDKVQYGITALREGETIKPSKTKKASHKK